MEKIQICIQTFILVLCIPLGQILQELDTVSKVAQVGTYRFNQIINLLKGTWNISETRKNYDKLKYKAEKIREQWSVGGKFVANHQIKYKKHCDDLSEDSRLGHEEIRFKNQVLYQTIGIKTTQLSGS